MAILYITPNYFTYKTICFILNYMEKKTVLVTGGNGFIGAHIVNNFVDKGYKVFVLCRKNKSNNKLFMENLEKGNIEIIQGDISNPNYSNFPNVNYIVHVAGLVSAYGKLDDFMKINYKGTEKLLEFAKTLKKLECFSYISSTAVYGYYGYKNLSEDDLKKPFNNPYSISKFKTEELVKDFCTNNNIDYLILRPGNVYGEYDYTSSHEIYSRVKRQKMSICAGGKYESCFVYGKNLAEAIVYTTLKKDTHNTDYNITDGNTETLKEYLTKVANEFGVKPKFLNFPAPIAKTVATLIEGIYKLFNIKKAPLITKFSIWQNCADYSFSIDKLLSTGYKKPFNETDAINNTVKWFNSTDN